MANRKFRLKLNLNFDPQIIRLVLIAGAILVAALAAMGFTPAFQSWHDKQELRRSHITYIQYPCETMNPAGGCPAYRLDVFGDGTVIYKSTSDTRIKGTYTYHVADEPLHDFMRDFSVSTFWSTPMPAGPSRNGGSCLVILQMHNETHRNGCLKWKPDSDQALDDPGVSESVTQLEALTQVNSLARGDGRTQELMRKAKPYKGKLDSL